MANPPNRLLELRRARDWSQQDVAQRVGCSKMQVSGLERGVREFSLSMMRRFAEVFEVSVAELLASEDNPIALSEEERQLIERLREASDEEREQLHRVADVMLPWRGSESEAA